MKKRFWLLGFIALDIAALPAAAQMVDRVSFSVPQIAVHSELPRQDGLAQMFVTSNAPFTIVADGAVGPFDIVISQSGQVGQQAYGENAQMPGLPTTCSVALSSGKTTIYSATQKTAKSRGSIPSQSVFIQIRYPKGISPNFDVLTEEKSTGLAPSAPCGTDQV